MLTYQLLFIPSSLAVAYIIDLIIGDPIFMPHPIRFIGKLITFFENFFSVDSYGGRARYNTKMFIAGAVTFILVIGIVFVIVFSIGVLAIFTISRLFDLSYISIFLLYFLISTVLCFFILATGSLKSESSKVEIALISGDIITARKELSMIVGRDTVNLDSSAIVRAAVETISENTCDAVVAPMLYYSLGSAPIAYAYKAINTLDSMVGYKNDKYFYFGKVSAIADDVFNFIPAILSSYFMLIAGFTLGLDYKNAYKIYIRDRYNHSSPNSGKTEAICAGLMGIRLGGPSYYKGVIVDKPFIGDELRSATPSDISLANKIMLRTSLVSLLFFTSLGSLFILTLGRFI